MRLRLRAGGGGLCLCPLVPPPPLQILNDRVWYHQCVVVAPHNVCVCFINIIIVIVIIGVFLSVYNAERSKLKHRPRVLHLCGIK
jgi:hypothetical protein